MSAPRDRQGLRLLPGRLAFTFDGRRYEGRQGDTAASALLAHGVRLVGRSIKARRVRGIVTAGPEEPNALFTVGTGPAVIPNVRATRLVLRAGLALRSQNRWPSLRLDAASLLKAGGGLFGAGFYYKTFFHPSWHAWEPLIRRLAGLGSAPGACELPPPRIEHLSCDVLVAGAGVSGLVAARTLQRAGARVIVCEREPACGGELEFESGTIENQPALDWVRSCVAELETGGGRVLLESTLVGGTAGEVLVHGEPGGLSGADVLYRIRPRFVINAMGAIERGYAFIDNDRPGVMMLSAAERYLARYGVRVGGQVVICASHDRAYRAAARLLQGGVQVAALVDTRDEPQVLATPAIAQARRELEVAGVSCLAGHLVAAAEGGTTVTAARIGAAAGVGRMRRIGCDAILVSDGWTPAVHASLQAGGARRFEEGIAAFVPTGEPGCRATVGAANGALELEAACRDAWSAANRAARALGLDTPAGPAPHASGDPAPRVAPCWRAPATKAQEKRQFVDLQNDVTVADLRLAVAEGFGDIEHAKRYTALGFGTDQGRLGGLTGAAILADLRGVPLAAAGISRPRPPYQSVPLQVLAGMQAGDALRPARRTPLHAAHLQHGGVLEPSGLWLRPRNYAANGADAATAAVAEAARVRAVGGIVDASTLGKIEIAGPDAAAFLDYLYLTPASPLKVGRSRYAVNLREDGMVIDDGLLLRLAPDRFRATTGTGHAEEMLAHFEFYRATARAADAVTLTDVTEAWSVIAAAGPRARETLLAVLPHEWQPALRTLGHMGFACGEFGGSELVVLRASFSGELAYELHCRPRAAPALWDALCGAGLAPYGLDALDILRVEKGYLTHSEISGQVTPGDLNLDAFLRRQGDYVGAGLLGRPAFQEASRPRLVGIRAADGRAAFQGGAQIVTPQERRRPCGYVTSAAWSPALGEWIGLALIARTVAEGSEVIAADPLRGGEVRVRVTAPVHLDPAGERMRS